VITHSPKRERPGTGSSTGSARTAGARRKRTIPYSQTARTPRTEVDLRAPGAGGGALDRGNLGRAQRQRLTGGLLREPLQHEAAKRGRQPGQPRHLDRGRVPARAGLAQRAVDGLLEDLVLVTQARGRGQHVLLRGGMDLAQLGQHREPQAVAGEARVEVALVLPPREPQLDAVGAGLLTRDREQRAGDPVAARRHSQQRAPAWR
jgi:hypothetical protein